MFLCAAVIPQISEKSWFSRVDCCNPVQIRRADKRAYAQERATFHGRGISRKPLLRKQLAEFPAGAAARSTVPVNFNTGKIKRAFPQGFPPFWRSSCQPKTFEKRHLRWFLSRERHRQNLGWSRGTSGGVW